MEEWFFFDLEIVYVIMCLVVEYGEGIIVLFYICRYIYIYCKKFSYWKYVLFKRSLVNLKVNLNFDGVKCI